MIPIIMIDYIYDMLYLFSIYGKAISLFISIDVVQQHFIHMYSVAICDGIDVKVAIPFTVVIAFCIGSYILSIRVIVIKVSLLCTDGLVVPPV